MSEGQSEMDEILNNLKWRTYVPEEEIQEWLKNNRSQSIDIPKASNDYLEEQATMEFDDVIIRDPKIVEEETRLWKKKN